LLRQFAAEAGAAPGGDDQGVGRSHRNRLNQCAGARQPRVAPDDWAGKKIALDA
jgi:hypothetical protein